MAELIIIEPRALLRAIPNVTPFIGRVVNPLLPLFPQIQDVSRPLFLRNLFWAPQVLNLFLPYLLPFLALVAIRRDVVYFVKVNLKPTASPSNEDKKPISLIPETQGGSSVYIKTQEGFPAWHMNVGGHMLFVTVFCLRSIFHLGKLAVLHNALKTGGPRLGLTPRPALEFI